MKTNQVYNHSRCDMEDAARKECPACRGFGNYSGNEDACLCNGYGWLWMAATGWVRAPYARMTNSQLH